MEKDLKQIALEDLVDFSRTSYFNSLEAKHFKTSKQMRPDPNSNMHKLLEHLATRVNRDYLLFGQVSSADYYWQKKPVAPEPSAFEELVMKPASFVLPDTKPVKFSFEFTKSGIVVRKEIDNVAMEMRSGKSQMMKQMLAYMDPEPNVLYWPARITRSPAQSVAVANPSKFQLQTPKVLLEQMERAAKDIDLTRSLSLTCSSDTAWLKSILPLPIKPPTKF